MIFMGKILALNICIMMAQLNILKKSTYRMLLYIAIIMLLVFVVFPCLLLCLFPCRCFQRFLHHYEFRNLVLTTFMDAFQGCYKDGTNGTRDCRYFAAMYFILLGVLFGSIATALTRFVLPATISILITFAVIIVIARPYKSPAHIMPSIHA